MPILVDKAALHPSDILKITETTTYTQEYISALQLPITITLDTVTNLLTAAHVISSEDFGATAAVTWANNFQLNPDLLLRDKSEFINMNRDLPQLARSRQQKQAPYRLSVERIWATFGPSGHNSTTLSSLDFQRLLDFATLGVRIFTPPSITPCSDIIPLRKRYVQVQCAIHKLFDKQMQDETVLILPLDLALTIPNIHLQNSQHWTTKKNKAQGRAIADLSNSPDPTLHTPLNGASPADRAAVTDMCNTVYGEIKHPTLKELALMVLFFAEEHSWDDIILWKMDLKGAFTLLWINPDHTPLLAFLLVGGLVIIHLVGIFGWAGMPHPFHVLTKALEALITSRISGKSRFYVDDLMAVSSKVSLLADQDIARSTIMSLAGPNALATDKDETGRRLDFIGWQFCLDTKTISLSHHNLLKTCHAFFCFNINDKLPCVLVQRMSSLAIRISELCPYMKPHTSNLTTSIYGFNLSAPSVRHTMSTATKCEITIWRTFLILIFTETISIIRPISFFRPIPPTIYIAYDASLTGLAAGLSIYTPVSKRYELVSFAAVDGCTL